MSLERTLSIVKPDAVRKNAIGKIVDRFETAGLKVVACKMMLLTRDQAEGFYVVHRERVFFRELVEYMISKIYKEDIDGQKTMTREGNKSFTQTKKANLRDYGDTCSRMMLATGIFTSIGGKLCLVESRKEEAQYYLETLGNNNARKIYNILKKYHKKNFFVKIAKFNTPIGTGDVMNTNFCKISVCENRKQNRVIIVSAIDNLIKGGSGQAVQNMNIAFGMKETLGLI